jgi:hypothetical protein
MSVNDEPALGVERDEVSDPYIDLTQCVPPRANGVQPVPYVLPEPQRTRSSVSKG